MPRPVAVLTFEEIVARQARARELRRAQNKRFYEKNQEKYREYYGIHKDRLNRRTCELKHAQLLARKAAAAAPPTPPDL